MKDGDNRRAFAKLATAGLLSMALFAVIWGMTRPARLVPHPALIATDKVWDYTQPSPKAETEDAKLRRGCKAVHLIYDNKPIGELSRNDLKMLHACEVFGY